LEAWRWASDETGGAVRDLPCSVLDATTDRSANRKATLRRAAGLDRLRLDIALVLQAGRWRYVGRAGVFGAYAYKVDALDAFPMIVGKLRRHGWVGPIHLLVQQRWGELVRDGMETPDEWRVVEG
jgi:hypothetical protein